MSELRKVLLGMPTSGPVGPWGCTAVRNLGGLNRVGFFPKSDLVIAYSALSGKVSVVDARSGERLLWESWPRPGHLMLCEELRRMADLGLGGISIGPEDAVPVAGPGGCRVLRQEAEGWLLEALSLGETLTHIFLSRSTRAVSSSEPLTAKVQAVESLVGVGFSPSGRSFVVASESELVTYYGRTG